MMRERITLAVLVLCTGLALALPAPKGERVLLPFDYRGVTLLDGPVKRQFDEVRDFYLRIRNDDLLLGFRRRAGLPSPGVELGGWYNPDRFHIFPQILSGLARMYASTGDPACRDKANDLFAEWAKCIEPDGFFFYSRTCNAPHYNYCRWVAALVDMYLYCGNDDAPKQLARITDWAEKHLDRKNQYANTFNSSCEWYTLGEDLYRAYLATGDARYREFGRVWEYPRYWNLYAEKHNIHDVSESRPGRPIYYHAYSHVNTLSSAAMAYAITGERHYLDTLVNAYDYLQSWQCYATGGFGPNEGLLVPADFLSVLDRTHNHFETQCGTWAAFKMSKYLVSFTGDGRYGDWMERLLINGVGASIPMSAQGGVFYYSDYNTTGGRKVNTDDPGWLWPCCAGTRPIVAADFHDIIYFHDDRDVYVNLYVPSRLEWKRGGNALTLSQKTRFPEADTVEMMMALTRNEKFTLALRIPGWLAAPMEVSVNGTRVELQEEKHWARIERQWKSGDRITLRLPMQFWAKPLLSDRASPTAILYGPTVLSFRTPGANPAKSVDLNRLAENFVPTGGEPLTYHLTSDASALVRPFYTWKERERYFVYLDPAKANIYPYQHQRVELSREWNRGTEFTYANAVGATAKFSFEGTGVRWLGWRFDDGGYAEVKIDGKVVGKVDQYGPERHSDFDWKIEHLAPGTHTLELKILPDKPKDSSSTFLNIAGFEVLP